MTATFFSWANFHDASTADFRPCETPDRPADFVSGSGSRYWNTPSGVIRESDHWMSGIRSCNWFLGGASYRGPERAGFCRYEDFFSHPEQCEAWRLERAAWHRAMDEREAARETERQLLQPGNSVRATRTVTERISSRRYQQIVERVTFTLAKITPRFFVATDGRRFARHTLSAFAAVEVAHA
jgi:hypothetical protein